MNRTLTTGRPQQQPHTDRQHQEHQTPERASGCLLRLYWVLVGNALVALCAYLIVQGHGPLTLFDLGYWLGVASLVGARYVDVGYLQGLTAEGQPATMRHWRRYSLVVLGLSVTVWVVAHGFAYLSQ